MTRAASLRIISRIILGEQGTWMDPVLVNLRGWRPCRFIDATYC